MLLSVPIPRMRMVALPAGPPLSVTCIPATRPWRAFIGLFSAVDIISFTFTTDTAPVRSVLRSVRYPTETVTPSRVVTSSSKLTFISLRPFTATVWDL